MAELNNIRKKFCWLLGHDFKFVGGMFYKCNHCEKIKVYKIKLYKR